MTIYYTPDELEARLRAGAADGLNTVAAHVQGVAVPRTPLEIGDLRDSLVISRATAEDLTSAVSSDSPYAVPQHERLEYRHDDGGPKYLESAALDSKRVIPQILREAVRRKMGG